MIINLTEPEKTQSRGNDGGGGGRQVREEGGKEDRMKG